MRCPESMLMKSQVDALAAKGHTFHAQPQSLFGGGLKTEFDLTT